MQCEVAQLRPMETPSREVWNSGYRFCRAWSDIEARQDPIEHGPGKRDIFAAQVQQVKSIVWRMVVDGLKGTYLT